jgi:hypothetical protein
MKTGRWLYAGVLVVALVIGLGFWKPTKVTAKANKAPTFVVDPFWPKPNPAPVGYNPLNWPGCGPNGCQATSTTGGDGIAHTWVNGEVAGSCTDADGNVYTFNRGWETGVTFNGTANTGSMSGMIVGQDASASSKPSPPVVEYSPDGTAIAGFGNPSLNPGTPAGAYTTAAAAAGRSTYLPNGAHGCFVDYQGNLWVGGNGDGVVQEYVPASAAPQGSNATFLQQIGVKDNCDTATGVCGEAGQLNSSHTQLNEPADIAIDPKKGPVSGSKGDVYIADGYGNHRVVVFNANGEYVGQWGQACDHNESPDGSNPCPPGTFGASGGGHPHCVILGNDGLVYVCDRPNNRIQVFKKTCAQPSVSGSQPLCQPDFIIYINGFTHTTPAKAAAIMAAGTRACDMDFYPNKDTLASKSPGSQRYIIDTDLGNDNTWILDGNNGFLTVGALGRCGQAPCPGHNAGEFAFGHTNNVAPDNSAIYVAETITGRRIQKFVRIDGD